jgi:two-component system, chemotaxis family, chemotaxis protein CheY
MLSGQLYAARTLSPGVHVARPLLIVEDDEAIEFALADLVTDSGYRSVAARDGIEALEVLKRERPFVIVLDLFMPRMDGYELIRALRADPELAAIPVLVVTAGGRVDEAALGGVPVFEKPLDPTRLMQAIRAHAPA